MPGKQTNNRELISYHVAYLRCVAWLQ